MDGSFCLFSEGRFGLDTNIKECDCVKEEDISLPGDEARCT